MEEKGNEKGERGNEVRREEWREREGVSLFSKGMMESD